MKVCFISGSRADYGLLSKLMRLVKKEKKLIFQLILTGSHLSKKHGFTCKEVFKDGFKTKNLVDLKINKDGPNDICNYISTTVLKISNQLRILKPDIVIILGDRYEIFASCSAAYVHQIPICHLHGGELSKGSIDDSFRHSITKMSNIHLVANTSHAKRVRQLGEKPKNIFVVGGFGVDLIKTTKFLKKEEVEKNLGFKFFKKNLIVTYHPETLGNKDPKKPFQEILKSIKNFKDIQFLFTKSNADTNSMVINKMIDNFVRKNKNCKSFKSMGQLNYLSSLKFVDGIIGNSSSGLLEVPTFRKATLNIGDRQSFREKSQSVIDVIPEYNKICKGIRTIYQSEFKKKLLKTKNPYGKGGASKKSLQILKKIRNKQINLEKDFVEIH